MDGQTVRGDAAQRSVYFRGTPTGERRSGYANRGVRRTRRKAAIPPRAEWLLSLALRRAMAARGGLVNAVDKP